MPQFQKILKSQRGGKILIDHEGYLYNYLRETAKGSTWACRAKYKLNCNTRIYYMTNRTDLETTVDHNHPPKVGEARTIEILRKLKTCNNNKYSYKVKKELMKGVCDESYNGAPPTLLNARVTGEVRKIEHEDPKQSDTEMLVDVDTGTLNVDTGTLNVDTGTLNVDTGTLNVDTVKMDSVVVDTSNEVIKEGISAEEYQADMTLQTIIGQLLDDPLLLQGLVASLTEGEGIKQQSEEPNNQPCPPPTSETAISPGTVEQSNMVTIPNIITLPHHPQMVTSQINTNSTTLTIPTITSTMPNTIISNQIIYKRMGDAGSTLYFSPPALNNPYCRQCARSFTTEQQLDEHYRSLKSCDMCKIAFCIQEHYQRHMDLNHPDGIKSAWGSLCETCGRVFGVAFQLDSHRAKCSNRLSLRCPRCFFSFGFEEDLKRHKEEHEDMQMLKCRDCLRTFPTETGLQGHRSRRLQNKGPYTCMECLRVFCLKCDFAKHVKGHFAEAHTEPMVCKFCTLIFSGSQQLLAHEATHLDVNICKYCGVNCIDYLALARHEKEEHSAELILHKTSSLVDTQTSNQDKLENSEFFKGVVNEMESLINSL